MDNDDDNDWIIPVTIRQDEPTNGTERNILLIPTSPTKVECEITNGTETSRLTVEAGDHENTRRTLVDETGSAESTMLVKFCNQKLQWSSGCKVLINCMETILSFLYSNTSSSDSYPTIHIFKLMMLNTYIHHLLDTKFEQLHLGKFHHFDKFFEML